VSSLRDLYPPLAPPDEPQGGLVSGVRAGMDAKGGYDRSPVDVHQLADEVRRSSAFLDDVFAEVARVVVGQRDMVERVLIGLLTGGHCLIEGVPGLAKTLLVKTLAQTIHARK